MVITIRNATINDYKELYLIYEELDEFHRINYPELFVKPHNYARAEEYLCEVINDDNKVLFVAEFKSKVIGFAECFIIKASNFSLIKEREWVQLDNIVVRRDYQSNHIGTLLFNKVVEWTKDKGINRIELKVYLFNTSAISFYLNKGFEDLNRTMYLDLNS